MTRKASTGEVSDRGPEDGRVVVAIPCLMRGGTEHQTLSLVLALREEGWRPEVWVYFEVDPRVEAEFHARSVEVRRLAWPRSIGVSRLVIRLAQEFRREQPNLVHVQYMAPGLAPILAARFAGVPHVVATVHHLPPSLRRVRAGALFRWASGRCDRVVFVSESARRAWSALAMGTSRSDPRHLVIRNPAPYVLDSPARAEDGPDDSGVSAATVGVVARLVTLKGIDVLLDALARMRAEPWRLRIVGTGPEEERLRARAQRLGIGERVTWAGETTHEGAIAALRRMDLVVVPSREEGLGLVALEAMACGRPVVASDVGGLREVVVPEETGLLVPPSDPEALGHALLRLLRAPNLRHSFGLRGLRRAREDFGWEAYRAAVHRLHGSIVEASLETRRPRRTKSAVALRSFI